MSGEPEGEVLDCETIHHVELAERLTAASAESVFTIKNIGRLAEGFGAGFATAASIQCVGNIGDFAFLLGQVENVEVDGKAGHGCAHSMVSGRLLVRGAVGDYFGAFATGGALVVHGQAKHYCAHALSGAEIFVRGAAGNYAGSHMRDGVLILGNGAGEETGFGMTGGILFIRGEVKSLADGMKLIRMKDAESLRLSLLLARAGVKGGVKEFKAYRPKASK